MFTIQIITEPTVKIAAQGSTNLDGLAEFLGSIGVEQWDRLDDLHGRTVAEPDVLVEAAARLCYMSYNRGRGHQEHIENILNVKHGSVLEHATFTLAIAGVSRSLSHELVRHRAGFSYSQLSQRYVGPDQVRFVLPPALHGSFIASQVADMFRDATAEENAENWRQAIEVAREKLDVSEPGEVYKLSSAFEQWHYGCQTGFRQYKTLLGTLRDDMPEAARKQIFEAARSVLPNAIETRLFVTGNARSWRHWLVLRGTSAADAEIRRLACVVARLLKAEAPELFRDVTVTIDGTVSVAKGSV